MSAVETPAAVVEAGVDALVIATATPGHAPLLRLAAAARLPAFCEKPVALDLATILDAGYRAARDAVASGALGNLLVVRAATHDTPPPTEEFVARSGGIFRDLHIHDFDAVRYVTGQEITEVYADGAVRELGWFERHGDVDTAVAVLRLSGGALGILTGTRWDPLGYDVRLEVFGSADSIAVGVDERTPLRSVEPGAPPVGAGYADFIDRFGPAYRSELAAFVAAVREGGTSACTLDEARAALVVALAADRSRSERRPVSIDEVTGTGAPEG